VTGPAISPGQRWAHVARLLNDTALDPTDRVAGSLLLLYGQPLSRIAAMTTSQITRRDGTTHLLLGRHDVPVPAPLAVAIDQLTSNGRTHRGVGSPQATTWLFPGHLPGRPITPSRLGERLRHIGIYAQTGRRAALLDLAAQLPAAVLADLLGLHENTAAKWINQAGGDWTRYAAELARNQPHQP
jgi:integrase